MLATIIVWAGFLIACFYLIRKFGDAGVHALWVGLLLLITLSNAALFFL